MKGPSDSIATAADIAVIGMAARFPGAASVDAFWANLRDGVESICRLSDDELVAAGVDRAALEDPAYVKACPVLDDIDKFDASFFGFSARDASVMDPAHRIFLEIAWAAFENAGYTALPEEGPVAVFAAAGAPLYMQENLRTNPDLMRSMGDFLVRHTGNDMNFLATRVSYEMDLRGPSMNVQTACSSSLTAVHLACQSLSRGECKLALAGGATVIVPQAGYHFKEGEILSPDGHCRPFDAKSAGTVFGSGAGALILKRLSDALDDGDTIHAVIKGSAINNDGAMKVSYLAPGVEGQASVINAALKAADVSPDTISYIETHGTGTLVGDPIEVEALNEAYRKRTERRHFCAIGSVKSNIGHLGEAAGAASLIKAIMALKHRQLPPSLGFETPNPAIDFANSPFFVNASLREWTGEGPLRCGVTALGAGGANCHVILEEAPASLPGEGDKSRQLIVLSAKSKTALDTACDHLAATLEADPTINLADAAWTLAMGRRALPHRRAVSVASTAEAIRLLRERALKHVVTGLAGDAAPKTVFMFPGGGAQYAGMGRELYETEEVYRDAIDACLAIIEPALGRNLRELMYPAPDDVETATRTLERPSLTLPSLFATEYAMAKLFMSWGVTPDAFIGHSVGEYAAACLAGVMSLEDTIKLVMMRGRLFEVVEKGSMLSVPMSEADLRAILPAGLDIAAVNGPELVVASGSTGAINALRAILESKEIDSTPIHIDVAAHSAMLDPVLGQFRSLCQSIQFQRPQTPFVSNVTGKWISPAQAMSAEYWVSHLRSTVRFADGLATLRELGDVALLEAGPGRTLSSLARAQAEPFRNAYSCIRHPQEKVSDVAFALTSLGQLWSVGVEVEWSALYDGQLRNRIPLPAYPFESKSYWVQPGKALAAPRAVEATRESDVANWFHTVSYVEAPLIVQQPLERPRIWLMLADTVAEARRLARALAPDRVIIATPGAKFGERFDGAFRVDPANPEHLALMLGFMEESVGMPDHVVMLARGEEGGMERRFLAPTHVLQALGELSSPVQVSFVTSGVSGAGGHQLDPESALTLGPALVGPREFEHMRTRIIDLPRARLTQLDEDRLDSQLALELRAETDDAIVALTPGTRWVRRIAPAPLPALTPDDTVGSARWVRENGCYLITGGLGGIGLEVAERLASARHVKLALLSREGLPPEQQWERIHASKPNSRVGRQIARVRALRRLGAQVRVLRGDVTDENSLASVIEDVHLSFGPLNGVFHGAGVMDDAPMMTKSAEAMKRVLAPKVAGTRALDTVITEPLDFFVIFSSVASYLGLPGQVDYTAANAFQDAFARSRAQRAPGRTLVINWNAWRDVGMAAAAHQRETEGEEPAHASAHPAFDGYTDVGAERTFVSTFRDGAEWLLSEHVVKGGGEVLPGTAFVELARAAFAEGRDVGAIELSQLSFASPFRAEKGQPRRLAITVTPTDTGARIAMRAEADPDATPIVTGEARALKQSDTSRVDLDAVRAACQVREFAPADHRLDQDFMQFGPRWANIRSIRFGANQALAEIVLDDRFASDIGRYGLHPAMLDMATGGAQALIPGVNLARDFYVPLGYDVVRVYGAMPARVLSVVRCLPDTADGLAYFDVTICDADGRIIADISRFTMRRIEATGLAGPSSRPPAAKADTLAAALREGIASSEGLEALDRIMAQPGLVQVIASSVNVEAWNRKLSQARVVRSEEEGAIEGFQRPPGAPEFVAPSTPAERVLAKIWSELLGYDAIGVADNFFDLGGNSLLGVRLFANVRKKFGVSLPLATLFEAQTITDLARLVAEPEQDVAPQGAAAWSPMVKLKGGSPDVAPLFFIHGSRGNVLVFKSFADRMPADQPVYALQAAGVDGKQAPDETIEVMAERYLAAIRQVQPKGPYMLAGYSGGGVIGYEITRRLQQVGEATRLLMLIDTLEPSQMRTRITMLDRVKNAYKIQLSRYLMLPRALWTYQVRPRLRRMMGVEELISVRTPLEAASDLVDKVYKTAQLAYNTPEMRADVVIIRAKDARMQFLRSGPNLGWTRFIKGRIRRFDVDGEHDFIFSEPALPQLIAAFDEVLNRPGWGARPAPAAAISQERDSASRRPASPR